jgi:hypothetical protein
MCRDFNRVCPLCRPGFAAAAVLATIPAAAVLRIASVEAPTIRRSAAKG